MAKRVYCLYRVSTKKQVEKDDIPMQKQKCHEFAGRMGWEIVKEYSEKGVSGYKVSANDRDAVIEIRKAAAAKKFDVLLVFMFDRLGRREDETPFVLEWFVKNGIEVWSTMEGEQKFENHSDKLINYIRFWQASEESNKTSIRVKTRMGQIVQEGRFRGGIVPYGYRIVKKGRLGKRNKELYDLEIEPEEAEIVRRIYDLADRYGYGGRKISTTLLENGIVNNRTAAPFHYSSVQNILRNIIYMGILRSADARSEVIQELQIITPEQWQRVERLRQSRMSDYYKKWGSDQEETVKLESGEEMNVYSAPPRLPLRNTGKTLLSGNIFCGHCGGRIFATTTRKSHHAGCPDRVPIYKCYNRTQHKELCDGPTSYRAWRIDNVVDSLLQSVFNKAKLIDESELTDRELVDQEKELRRQLERAKKELSKATGEMTRWSELMLDSIDGNCPFTPEIIQSRMEIVQKTVNDQRKKIQELQEQVSDTSGRNDEIQREHRSLLSWAEIFQTATPEERRMIAAHMIKSVTVSKGYEIKIELKITEAQYLQGLLL